MCGDGGGRMGLKRTTPEGNMFCACVTRILKKAKAAEEKCLAFRTEKPTRAEEAARAREREMETQS
jgi:hypothetical protein